MSLIEEALRRAQQDRPSAPPSKRQRPTPPPEPSSTSEPVSLIGEATKTTLPTTPTPSPWTDSALNWLRLGLVGTGVVAMAFWTYQVSIGSRHVVVSAPQVGLPPTEPGTPRSGAGEGSAEERSSRPEPLPPPKPTYTLNGIVQGVGSEPFAVINDTIVQLGETIDGATLVALGSGVAKLRRDDDKKEIVLKTTK